VADRERCGKASSAALRVALSPHDNFKLPAGIVAVGISALLPCTNDNKWHERDQFISALNQLDLAVEPVELLERIDGDYTDFAPMLKLTVPKKSLVDCFQEGAPAEAGA